MVAAIFLCLWAGCSTGRQAGKVPAAKFEGDDDFKIEAAVYAYLLDKQPWGGDEYAAIFLTGSDERAAALIRKLPHHVPPLKSASAALLRPDQAPLDKATGKPGLILSAKALEPTNGVSEAVGTWSGGGTVSGLTAFVLVEVDGEWTIQGVK